MKKHVAEKSLRSGPRAEVYFPSGGHYRGDWLNDVRHGNGCMVYSNGDRYFGDWVDDVREGVGAFYHCADEKYRLVYTGEWKRDRPSGQGVFHDYKQNCRYEGQWENGRRHGMGKVLIGTDARPIYEGQWVNDLREGQGKERCPNGNVFVGNFEKDGRHGAGSYFLFHKQRRLDGIWKKGTFIGGTYTHLRTDSSPESICNLPVLEVKDPQSIVDNIMKQNHSQHC